MSRTLANQIELHTVQENGAEEGQESLDATEGVHFALPPADRGKDAYLVLASCFVLEALVWGFPFAFGVFQNYYSTHEPFNQDVTSIAAIGTTSTGIMYFGAPLVYGLLRKFPRWRKGCSIFGFVLMLAALIGASFANSVTQLLATQGILYGIGGAIHYFPAFMYLDEWFFSRRGFAYGIVWAGSGAAGIAIPLSMEWVLQKYGFRTALRSWTMVLFVLTLPTFYFMKGRLPVQQASTGPQKLDLSVLRSRPFWILQTGNIVQGLGYFMPSLYLPSFAEAVGLSALAGTVAISLINAANVVGATFFGFLIDRCHVTTVINVCAIGTLVSCFIFWAFAVYLPVLFIFAIMYGIFAGGYAASWAGITDLARQKHPGVETGMVVALCAAGKGLGAVISGPLSGVLVRSDVWKDRLGFAFGSGYGYLIIFSGLTAGFSTLGWLTKQLGLLR